MSAGSDPRTPADTRRLDLDTLAAELRRYELTLIDHKYGTGPLTTEWFLHYVLAALDARHAIAERALTGRWVHAQEALAAGATAERTAAAMGLEPGALRAGLAGWADGQRRFGLITDAEHTEVLALAGVSTPRTPAGVPAPGETERLRRALAAARDEVISRHLEADRYHGQLRNLCLCEGVDPGEDPHAALLAHLRSQGRAAGREDSLGQAVRGFLAAWDDAGASWRSLTAPVAALRRALRGAR